MIELETGKEYRLTTSQFGSKMPSLSADGRRTVQATYTRGGYMLSQQAVDSLVTVGYKHLPDNIFNMPVAMASQLPKVDNMNIFSEYDTKRYRKFAHAFDLHSWAPVGYDPLETGSDRNLELDMGATVMSQNTLGTTTGYLTYGRAKGENYLKGAVQYRGFAPVIEAGFEYGGGDRYIISDNHVSFDSEYTPRPYFSAYAGVSLPLNLSSGKYLRNLTPSVKFNHVNALVRIPGKTGYDKGYEIMEAAVFYSQNMRMAYRGLAPRWGWSGRVSVSAVPFSSIFGKIYSACARVNLPGVARNHSLKLRGAVQYQDAGFYNLGGNVMFPRGIYSGFATEKLITLLGDYTLPLAYPDGGIPGVIYVKRIYANLFGGFSRFKAISGTGYRNVYSYGADVYFNVNPLRLVNGSIDFRTSLYRTSLDGNFNFSLGMSIDI